MPSDQSTAAEWRAEVVFGVATVRRSSARDDIAADRGRAGQGTERVTASPPGDGEAGRSFIGPAHHPVNDFRRRDVICHVTETCDVTRVASSSPMRDRSFPRGTLAVDQPLVDHQQQHQKNRRYHHHHHHHHHHHYNNICKVTARRIILSSDSHKIRRYGNSSFLVFPEMKTVVKVVLFTVNL